MALEKHTREIGPYTYEVTTLDAVKGRRAFVRLMNGVGSSFKDIASESDFAGNLLTKALNVADVDHFCDLFGEVTTVTGADYGDKTPLLTKQTFMTHFAGNYGDMAEWLAFCLEVNFGSFLSRIGELKSKFAVLVKTEEVPATG